MRRCTQAICIILLILLSVSIILDEPAILLAAVVPALGLLCQYVLFGSRMQELISSVAMERTLSRDQARKGMPIEVTAQLAFTVPEKLKVHIADLLPAQATLIDGTTEISAWPDEKPQACTFRYTMAAIVHGTHRFSGIRVTARNLFFEDSMILSREADTAPPLYVQPSGLFAPPPSELADGSLDLRKTSIWSGADVHSLRDYTPGDDLRHVDWKVSAKYDKLVIRKYTAPMSHPPLVIVDLPWNGAPFSEAAFNVLISEVTGMVQHTLHTYQYISVLFISGPNVVHLIREEKSMGRCLAEIRDLLHPAERPVHFYRTPDRSDLRSRVRFIENALPDETDKNRAAFLERIRDRYAGVLDGMRNPAFTGQVARALSQITFSEAFLFSIDAGDTSHIRHVVRPLRARNILIHTRIIGAADAAARNPAEADPGASA